jgi:histone-lysine N-methyltransferase SETD3
MVQKHDDFTSKFSSERIKCCVRSFSGSSSGVNLGDWVISQGGSVTGISLVNLAGRDGGSGWGLKAEAEISAGTKLIELPAGCQLTYSATDDAKLLRLIEKVPTELWGAKLALQVGDGK